MREPDVVTESARRQRGEDDDDRGDDPFATMHMHSLLRRLWQPIVKGM